MNTDTNILFINMPTLTVKQIMGHSTSRQIKAFPFGILYLSAVLKEQKHKGEIGCVDYLPIAHDIFRSDLDGTIRSEALKAASSWTPDILAFSFSMSSSWEFFNHSLPIIKEIWPEATIIVGGMHASNTVEHLLNNHDHMVDFVIAGEAEKAFPHLVEFLASGNSNFIISGVHARKQIDRNDCDEKPVVTSFMEMDVNEIPFPDYSLIDVSHYSGEESAGKHLFWDEINADSAQQRDASLFTSRGCPYHCTFCAAWTIHGRKMRLREPENVVAEMQLLNKEYGINHFHIYDDLPLVNKKRCDALLGAMSQSGIKNQKISFTQTFYVNTTSEDTIDAVIEYTNIPTISFAVESATRTMQKQIRKHVKLEKAAKLIKYAQSRGLIVTINIILGFPNETRELMQETVDEVKNYLQPNWTQYHIATPIVGTPMYDSFVEAGCIEDGPSSWMETLTNSRYFDSPWIGKDELNDFRYRANLDSNFVHNYDLQIGNYEHALSTFGAVVKLYPFQIYALNGMRNAHIGMGELDKADELRKRIRNAVFTDERAADHLIKYGDMFPEVLKFFTNREEIKPLIKDIDPIVLQDPETMISWLDTLDQEKYKQR